MSDLDDTENDQSGNTGPVCAWCLHQYVICGDYPDNEDIEEVCESCGKTFKWYSETTVDYYSSRVVKEGREP